MESEVKSLLAAKATAENQKKQAVKDKEKAEEAAYFTSKGGGKTGGWQNRERKRDYGATPHGGGKGGYSNRNGNDYGNDHRNQNHRDNNQNNPNSTRKYCQSCAKFYKDIGKAQEKDFAIRSHNTVDCMFKNGGSAGSNTKGGVRKDSGKSKGGGKGKGKKGKGVKRW
jgi:hypothetical protein